MFGMVLMVGMVEVIVSCAVCIIGVSIACKTAGLFLKTIRLTYKKIVEKIEDKLD
jgi:hypothetical protein